MKDESLLMPANYTKFINELSDKFDINPNTGYSYVNSVTNVFFQESRQNINAILWQHYMRYESIYQEARLNLDRTCAMAALKNMERLLGGNNDTCSPQMSFVQINNRINDTNKFTKQFENLSVNELKLILDIKNKIQNGEDSGIIDIE